MHILKFLNKTFNLSWLISFLLRKNILYIPFCSKCGLEMKKTLADPTLYKCNRSIGGIRCNITQSIYYGSMFWRSRLKLHEIFYILNEWRKDVSAVFVSIDLKKDCSTITRWYKRFDNLIQFNVNFDTSKAIGGANTIVEIDECLLVSKKYRRGRNLSNQKWLIGGVVRGNINEYFTEYVRNRSRSVLLEVIRRRVKPYSRIITDEWRGYSGLTQILDHMNYSHDTVNHSLFYVDPVSRANTQTVEGFWSVMKRILRKKGTNIGNVETRLKIFHVSVFKRINRKNWFTVMLRIMQDYTWFGNFEESS